MTPKPQEFASAVQSESALTSKLEKILTSSLWSASINPSTTPLSIESDEENKNEEVFSVFKAVSEMVHGFEHGECSQLFLFAISQVVFYRYFLTLILVRGLLNIQ